MKKLVILSVTFVFVALFSVVAFAQTEEKKDSPLLANWTITISAPGQELSGTLRLEKDGEGFKGAVNTEIGEAPFKNIVIKDDNTFTADISVNAGGQTMEGTITGKLDGESLIGEIVLAGFGSIPYSGKKG